LHAPVFDPTFAPVDEPLAGESNMPRLGPFALAAAAVLGVLAVTAPAHADFGAIAFDHQSCRFGRSWHFESPRRAAEVAERECASPGCKVVLEVGTRLCGALATTGNCHGAGWAARESREAARLAAIAQCERRNAGVCEVKVVDCNR
jgi:hypothetical protein